MTLRGCIIQEAIWNFNAWVRYIYVEHIIHKVFELFILGSFCWVFINQGINFQSR